MILQIHDELVFECPREEAERLRVVVKEKMENALTLRVPLVVETGCGPDWLAAK